MGFGGINPYGWSEWQRHMDLIAVVYSYPQDGSEEKHLPVSSLRHMLMNRGLVGPQGVHYPDPPEDPPANSFWPFDWDSFHSEVAEHHFFRSEANEVYGYAFVPMEAVEELLMSRNLLFPAVEPVVMRVEDGENELEFLDHVDKPKKKKKKKDKK